MTPDAVLLIDLENMIGANAKSATLAAKLDALTTQAGIGVPALAAYAGKRINPAGIQALQGRKIRLLTVGGDKDADGKALLAEAGKLARCARFIVASHDSRFAELADLGELEIITWANLKIAAKYTAGPSPSTRYPGQPACRLPSPLSRQARPASQGQARIGAGHGTQRRAAY